VLHKGIYWSESASRRPAKDSCTAHEHVSTSGNVKHEGVSKCDNRIVTPTHGSALFYHPVKTSRCQPLHPEL
jgi:hypothetical protein